MQKAPFNLTIIDPDEYITRKSCLPVSSYIMYESSTERFHPEGLFSEVIFGQLGSSSRLYKRGYMDLKTKVITPHLFKQILSLKKVLFTGILTSTTYAYFDNESKMLIKTTPDDPKGNTGYAFFLSVLPKLMFVDTGSVTTRNKIALVEKYKDRLFMDKMIIIPAGVRDIKIKNGRPSSEAINKLYLALLSLANSMPEFETEDPIYDTIRYQIQMKVVEIYDYLRNMMDGKHGFGQGKYASRDVVYSNRNVITAAVMSDISSPDSASMPSIDDVIVPLYQGIKGASPLVCHHLKNMFFDTVFSAQNNTALLINTDTLETEYCEVTDNDIRKYTTFEGMEKIINDFRDAEVHWKPFTINCIDDKGKPVKKYLLLVYDLGNKIYTFANKHDFIEAFAKKHRYRDDHPSLAAIGALGLTPDSYMVEGSVACYAYGCDVHTEDVDIVVRPSVHDSLSKRQDATPDEFGDFEITTEFGTVHVKTKVFGITSDADYNDIAKKSSIVIGEHTYISPEEMYRRYKSINRIKDRNKIEELSGIVVDETKIRPLYTTELMYIAGYSALFGKHCAATRYPVNNIQSMAIFKVHLMSTTPSRNVQWFLPSDLEVPAMQLPEYPTLFSPVRVSLTIHPSALELYGGDHDGDTMTLNILLSDEANKEAAEYLRSPSAMLNSEGGLLYGIKSGKSGHVDMALSFLTYHQLSK